MKAFRVLVGALIVMASLQASALTVGTVISNGLAKPYGIAVDNANNFYITDTDHHRVLFYAPDRGMLTNFAGLLDHPGANTDTNHYFARFRNPHGIIQARGGFVIADSGNNQIRWLDTNGMVTTLAGKTNAGYANGVGSAALFNFPVGVAVDTNDNIYVADAGNNAIRLIAPNNVVTTITNGFNNPQGVAVSEDGRRIFVADTDNQGIQLIQLDGGVVTNLVLIAGSPRQISGADDSIFGTDAFLNSPSGLLWLGDAVGLLVCDTGNHLLRRVYTNPDLVGIPGAEFSVELFAGTPNYSGTPIAGFADGEATKALFNQPTGLSQDLTGGYLIVDSANNAIRRIQYSSPGPPVSNPIVGIVGYGKDSFGERVTRLDPISQAVFNNDVIIAVLTESGTETYYTFGPTPANADTIPTPNRDNGLTPPSYEDGWPEGQTPRTLFDPTVGYEDVTLKFISIADGRNPSALVVARFQFRTSTPNIIGDNPVAFNLTSQTTAAQMFWTTNGLDPTSIASPTNIAYSSGTISLTMGNEPLNFKVRAFKPGYKPSAVVQKTFYPEDVVYNRISFGFEYGEASSVFIGAPGQTFYAPVTLSLLPNQTVYSLQLNFSVTNVDPLVPPVTPGAVNFQPMLMKPIPGISPVTYEPILPAMFDSTTGGLTNLLSTNTALNLLMVGWLERRGYTNLYDTGAQDLITYSQAHDTMFLSADGKVMVGGYSFVVPGTAVSNQTYQIKIGRPSATQDGVNQDVYIDTPTNGSLAAGRMNAIKTVTIGNPEYIVGDVAPFRWFNAGDFGDADLLNNDALQVFQSATYGLDTPPKGSDMYNAMDSSDGYSGGNPMDGNDANIDTILQGDGLLEVDDIYVTWRRSLDPSLKWVARFRDAAGQRTNRFVTNVFRGQPDKPAELIKSEPPVHAASATLNDPPAVSFSTGDFQVVPGQKASVPIFVRVDGAVPMAMLLLNLNVQPLDGSPALTVPVQFISDPAIGAPSFSASQGPGNFAAAWLRIPGGGLLGTNLLGMLEITIPTNATLQSAYRIDFTKISAATRGLAQLPPLFESGLLTLSNRLASSWLDGIPDQWRLKFFGSVSNLVSAAMADADGDGVPNWAEFKAGTNPNDAASFLHLLKSQWPTNAWRGLTLNWPSIANKTYQLEWSPTLVGTNWTALATNIVGTDKIVEFTDTNVTINSQTRFYRVRVVQ